MKKWIKEFLALVEPTGFTVSKGQINQIKKRGIWLKMTPQQCFEEIKKQFKILESSK